VAADEFAEQKRQMLDPWERGEKPKVLPKPNPESVRPGPDPEPPYPSGIFEDPEAPFPTVEFLAVNRWQGVLGGAKFAIYAGTAGYDRMQTGRLYCIVYDDSWNITRSRVIDLPQAGALRITQREGSALFATAKSGQRFVLNIPTLTLL